MLMSVKVVVEASGSGDTEQYLVALGLTEWEARVYLTLLREAPLTGYAVAKQSGVPRSKVYEVLTSLAAKGAAHISRSDPALYAPLAPKELLARMRREAGERLDAAEAAMGRYATQVASEAAIWDIQGRGQILDRALQLIRTAKSRVLMEIWSADAPEFADELRQAAERGVDVTVVAYGPVNFDFARVYAHQLTDEVTSGLGGRWLVLSKDSSEVIAGIVSSGTLSRAAWTGHPGLVVPITELVAHDIYKLEMLAAYGPLLEERFGPDLKHLRERFAFAQQQPDADEVGAVASERGHN